MRENERPLSAVNERHSTWRGGEWREAVAARPPYQWIRHPGHVGGDLAVLGWGFPFGNWLSPILFIVPMLFAHAYRVQRKGQVLVEKLGESYRRYAARTRLHPVRVLK